MDMVSSLRLFIRGPTDNRTPFESLYFNGPIDSQHAWKAHLGGWLCECPLRNCLERRAGSLQHCQNKEAQNDLRALQMLHSLEAECVCSAAWAQAAG